MNNLIPEKRLDKNGRLVTRHVKGNTSAASSELGIPAPSKGTDRPASKADYAKEIIEFLLEAAGDEDRDMVREIYAIYIGIRPLKLIHASMNEWGERDSDTFESAMTAIVTTSINENSTQSKRDRLVTSLVEAMPVISAFGGNYPQPRDIHEMMHRADKAAGLNKVRLNNDYTSEEDRAAFRLLAFDEIVGVPPKFRTREQLDQEAQWFDENMDALVPHIGSLRKRKTTDPELLKELVSDETPSAMSSGIL